ncbi:uncharacterized protein LOC134211428 [Armigeres subalbatus]|uniref:uncharacterized protein LOC134211428 n=1 Tax=Armigeres subalbatus TaxID=124917 RepID=UPI002ED02ECE
MSANKSNNWSTPSTQRGSNQRNHHHGASSQQGKLSEEIKRFTLEYTSGLHAPGRAANTKKVPPKSSVPPFAVKVVSERHTKVNKVASSGGSSGIKPGGHHNKPNAPPQQQKSRGGGQQKQHKCKVCGHGHKEADCSHKDALCFMCRKKGHIASVCREKIIKAAQQQSSPAIQVHVHVHQSNVVQSNPAGKKK